jgi:glycyl-tRNA synthetase alpha chain
MLFQEILSRLNDYWSNQGCAVIYPHDSAVGAGTFYPATFFRALNKQPWRVAYLAPTRRPSDGRYGDNPYRFQHYLQYQVLLQPSPANSQDIYLQSLYALGIDPAQHDLRFVEDNWEQASLSAWGLGWEVWLDGMEISQFTYLQQLGGVSLEAVPVELTYGLERIAMYLQNVSHAYQVRYSDAVSLGDLRRDFEWQHCDYNFNHADDALQRDLFNRYEAEATRLLEIPLVYPAYEFVMKGNHAFDVLDARGSLSQSERQTFVQRLRRLSEQTAAAYLDLIELFDLDAPQDDAPQDTSLETALETAQVGTAQVGTPPESNPHEDTAHKDTADKQANDTATGAQADAGARTGDNTSADQS